MRKRDERDVRPAPPTIERNATEDARTRFLEEVAAWLQGRFERRATVVVTGGGGIMLAQDENRPTGDLDIDTTMKINIEEEVRKMVARRPDADLFEIHTKQKGRGFTQVVRTDATGREVWRTKIDQKVVPESHILGKGGTGIEKRKGISGLVVDTYPLDELARVKTAKLNRRLEGRDLYDAGQLLAKNPKAYTLEERRRTVRRVRKCVEEEGDQWRDAVKNDRGTEKADPDEVLEKVWMTAMNDPATVIDEMEAPTGTVVQIGDRDEHDVEISCATTGKCAVIARSMSEKALHKLISDYRLEEEGLQWTQRRCPDASKTTTPWGRQLAELVREVPSAQLAMREDGQAIELIVADSSGSTTTIGRAGSAREIAQESVRIGRKSPGEVGGYTREIEAGLAAMRMKSPEGP